jgi:hypothetical protein
LKKFFKVCWSLINHFKLLIKLQTLFK